MTTEPHPVRAEAALLEPLSRTLARAFAADPLLAYVIPNSERRERLLPQCFRCILRLGFRYGEVYTRSPDLAGAAVWLSPNAAEASAGTMLRAAGFPLLCSLGPAAIWRLLSYFRSVDRLARKQCAFPHWYLLTLGVVPEHQRQGIGDSLLRCKLAELDAKQEACRLEAATGKQELFYLRHGFHTVKTADASGRGLCFSLMVRWPQAGKPGQSRLSTRENR